MTEAKRLAQQRQQHRQRQQKGTRKTDTAETPAKAYTLMLQYSSSDSCTSS